MSVERKEKMYRQSIQAEGHKTNFKMKPHFPVSFSREDFQCSAAPCLTRTGEIPQSLVFDISIWQAARGPSSNGICCDREYWAVWLLNASTRECVYKRERERWANLNGWNDGLDLRRESEHAQTGKLALEGRYLPPSLSLQPLRYSPPSLPPFHIPSLPHTLPPFHTPSHTHPFYFTHNYTHQSNILPTYLHAHTNSSIDCFFAFNTERYFQMDIINGNSPSFLTSLTLSFDFTIPFLHSPLL